MGLDLWEVDPARPRQVQPLPREDQHLPPECTRAQLLHLKAMSGVLICGVSIVLRILGRTSKTGLQLTPLSRQLELDFQMGDLTDLLSCFLVLGTCLRRY